MSREKKLLFLPVCQKDGEEGYPGNLSVSVSYTLTVDNSVEMVCRAVTDKVTPINVTNHAFFNLAGVRNNIDVLSHSLRLCSSQIIACDDNLVPTGRFGLCSRNCIRL